LVVLVESRLLVGHPRPHEWLIVGRIGEGDRLS
jgi:hypothetical protein